MKDQKLPDCFPISFNRGYVQKVDCYAIAEIFVNWGCLERWVYKALEVIDFDRADYWKTEFFQPINTDVRAKTALRHLAKEAATIDAKSERLVRDAFEKHNEVRKRRNQLAHGMWLGSAHGFSVIPLRLNSSKVRFASQIEVDSAYVKALSEEIKSLISLFAHLTVEMALAQERKRASSK